MMNLVALLKEVQEFDPVFVLGQAVREFLARELDLDGGPQWVALGAGVHLPPGAARRFGLARVKRACRAGCLMVGVDDESNSAV